MYVRTPILITILFVGSSVYAEPPADDLLAGPTIEEEEVTEQDMLSRKLQETGKSSNISSRQQTRIWMAALKSLQLTEEQTVAMEELKHELEEAQRTFQQMYGKEMKALRKEQVALKKDGSVPSTESRTRMMELRELAPDVFGFQEKAWMLLEVDQQTAFQMKYQALVEQEQKRKEEQKKNDRPMMDDMESRGFNPDNSILKDGQLDSNGDAFHRNRDSVDEASLRRIRFLRRLQELQKDN